MAKGVMPQEAVMRSVETAGRTVLFSALAVAISLAALAIFPLAFLRSFAYAGVAVVVLAAVAALVVLPALLAALGTKVDRLGPFRPRPRPGSRRDRPSPSAASWRRLRASRRSGPGRPSPPG